MIRQTSIEAYNQIKSEGLLSKLRFVVYDYIFKNGPVTQTETYVALGRGAQRGGTFTGRFSELEDRGVIHTAGTTVCKFSGRNVLLWDVTDRLPVEPDKATKKSRLDKLEERVDRIEASIGQ